MITVAEIQKKSERKYEEVLRDSLNEESCFPLEIRSNKVLSKDFIQMSKEIAEVLGGSKDRKGFGYSVISETIKTRQHGIQDIPKSIVFETLEDYLRFIKKDKEHHLMLKNYNFVKSKLPQLESWLKENPKIIVNHANVWPELVKVCEWFLYNFEPDKYYIRELPIVVHTKFIENQKGILKLLLDELIPDKINKGETDFEKRFRLKYRQDIVRFRFLDKLSINEGSYDDISIPLEKFKTISLSCDRIFFVENIITFLSFPETPHSIAVFAKGFAVGSVKNIPWLKEKKIYYWSDLDVQGFEMLSQLRYYYPQTVAFLMDKEILTNYSEFIDKGTLSNVKLRDNLTVAENDVYRYLSKNNLRLEQEHILHSTVVERLHSTLKGETKEL